MKPTLIYAYDPLCGWCFGFHPIVKKLADRFREEITIKVIPGGLAVDENAKAIEEGHQYILSILPQAEKTMGVKFGENFKLLMEEGSYFYNSEPSCRIQTVVNEMSPEYALEFAEKLQKAFFIEGRNLNKWETFRELLSEFPVESDTAKTLYESEKMKQKTREQFEWCKKNGTTGFPALLLQIENEIGTLSRGYRPYDILESHLHHLLNNIKKLRN